ncbi:hypothetical protein CRENBAI_012000 [Crenichthys baileyi]|uniref:Uncharacterized protein n=1 Tax=Crenichthys baileyi TaxID=28760 RepID=A0AAV9QW94_9TELE
MKSFERLVLKHLKDYRPSTGRPAVCLRAKRSADDAVNFGSTLHPATLDHPGTFAPDPVCRLQLSLQHHIPDILLQKLTQLKSQPPPSGDKVSLRPDEQNCFLPALFPSFGCLTSFHLLFYLFPVLSLYLLASNHQSPYCPPTSVLSAGCRPPPAASPPPSSAAAASPEGRWAEQDGRDSTTEQAEELHAGPRCLN